METYIKKLKHILPTFVAVTFGTMIGLGFIRWLFCIKFSLIDVNEEVWALWLPLIFPWIPITLFLRQRFRILTFKGDEDKGRFYFQIGSWGVMFAMLLVSQSYLTTATGKLKELSSINEIDKIEKVRYYKIAKFSVATYYGGSYTAFQQSGKYNQYLNFNIYFVAPMSKDTAEINNNIPTSWYGVKYSMQISNKISSEEKEQKYQAFYEECVDKMDIYDFQKLDYFERIPSSYNRQNYLKAIEARTKQAAGDNFIVLVPKQEKYEDRNGNNLAWIFGSFGIGLGVLLFSLIWSGYIEPKNKRNSKTKKSKQDDWVGMLSYLIPKGDHFATSVILNLNILVFLLMIFSGIHILSPNGLELLEWGANRRLETSSGEWWRLLTSMFLHGGIMHLIMNISGLIIAAIYIELWLGRKNYFILYFLSGICGSLASICWYSNTISVGASGAIFGLYGAILGILLTNKFRDGSKKGILIMIGLYVGINLLWGLTGGIDNAAHLGGLISGALIGILLYKLKPAEKPTKKKSLNSRNLSKK